ncbi:MAG: helix-turn-helix domain-containing protein [bacterium]
MFENLPEIMTAKDIAKTCQCSKNKVYELMKLSPEAGGIKSFGVGRCVRVCKLDFIQWIEAQYKKEVI